VVFPVNASVLSAFGTLVSPVRIDLARSMVRRVDLLDVAEREAVYDELRAEGRRVLINAGVPEGDVVFRYGVDARYAGQGNELTIWLGEGASWPVDDETLLARFTAEYEHVYGMSIPDVPVEVVTWRLSALTEAPRIEPAVVFGESVTATPHRLRPVRVSRRSAVVDVPVYRRAELGAGATFSGPAIVEERETTAVILPGWDVEVAPDGSLVATRRLATEVQS
jgi:N-methylhydantoinase A